MTTYRNESLTDGDTTRWLYDEPSGCMTNKVYADGKGPSYSYTPVARGSGTGEYVEVNMSLRMAAGRK